MTERIEDIIKKEGFEIIGQAAIEKGFSFHEKAIFCIKNGILKVYSIETLKKEQVNSLIKSWTIEELEKKAEEMKIRTGQPMFLEDGIYYDDIFLFDVKNGVAQFYMTQKKDLQKKKN